MSAQTCSLPYDPSLLRRLWLALERDEAGTLHPGEWNRRFLPGYFGRFAAADFHAILDRDLHQLHERRSTKIAYIAPRGGAKSTWATLAYPLRAAVELWEPYTLILSDSAGQANELLRHIRAELESNEHLAAVYPDACGVGPEWNQNRIRLRNGAVIEALGTGSKIRGRRNRSERPSLVIFDDVQSNEDIISAASRERAWAWATREVIPAGDERTTFLSVGSAIHREAVSVGLGKLAGWTGHTFRAIHAWPERMDLWAEYGRLATNLADEARDKTASAFVASNRAEMERGAAVYWPERYDLESLMLKRAEIGEEAFEAEYQGKEQTPAGAEFAAEFFDWPGLWFDAWPSEMVYRVQSLDPSKGGNSNSADFQAHVLLGYSGDGTMYAEAVLNHEPIPDMITRSLDLARTVGFGGPLTALAVENNDSLGMLVDEFHEQIQARQIVVPLQAIRNTVNKVVRVRRLGIYLARKQIRFRNTSGTRALVEQLREFPNAAHDDGPDALEMAVRMLERLTNPVS